MAQSTSSEHIQTRSKKGVIKINPKYLYKYFQSL